jgi:hypothetical protein
MKGVLSDGDDADFEFFVNAPLRLWHKDETEELRKTRASKLHPFIKAIEAAIAQGKQIALCDVAFANGADEVLMMELDKRGLLGKIAAYGAWNTAGNTLGTVLAQCAAIKQSKGNTESLDINQQFTFERYVDDWFYQARVRSRIEKRARDEGASPLDLNGNAELVEAQARRELKGYAQILAQRHFGSTLARCDVSLPWNRTFEVDLRAKLEPVSA